ncbi:hypothetical protein MARINON1_60386 [Marinobacter salarius]|nr:hypothetical protein MBHK15_100108 [Marinobacter salarius]VXC49815.1 hypothetical protein MARINON1_60386 [Marinobacter salarius]
MSKNMDVWIKLRIQFDTLTGSVSAFCMRKRVRYCLLTLKWAAIAFVLYDTFIYGINTGDTVIFSMIATAVVTSLLTRKKPVGRGEQSAPPPRRSPGKPGMRSVCEKCGAKVKINYGNAYLTLCEKCI